jgi:hypothetical protein
MGVSLLDGPNLTQESTYHIIEPTLLKPEKGNEYNINWPQEKIRIGGWQNMPPDGIEPPRPSTNQSISLHFGLATLSLHCLGASKFDASICL